MYSATCWDDFTFGENRRQKNDLDSAIVFLDKNWLNMVADMAADKKKADMELDMVADIEVDKLTDKVSDMVADMAADKKK